MTVLRHRVLDAQNQPVAGRVATVAAYEPLTAPADGYRRTKVVSATSGNDGWLSWTLPSGSRKDGKPVTYVVVGIEDRPVLVTPASGVSTTTVTESRTGVLPIAEPSEIDLVTEDELAERISGLTADLAALPELRAAFDRRVVPTLNVADYGTLDPTGVADNATIWQAALDAAAALPRAVRVIAPAGTYKMRQVKIGSHTHLDLTGVTLQYGGTKPGATPEGSSALLLAEGTEAAPLYGIMVTGGKIVGARANFTDITGPNGNDSLYLYRAPGAVVRDVEFVDAGQDGLTFDLSDGSIVQRCTFTDIGDAAVELRAGKDYIVRDCTMYRVRNGVASKVNLDTCLIQGNHITSFGDGVLAHGLRWRITDNVIDSIAIPAESLDGANSKGIFYGDQWSGTMPTFSSSDWVISRNIIRGRTGSDGIAFDVASGATTISGVVVADNIISGCLRGFRAGFGDNYTVSGNAITTAEEGVRLQGTASKVNVIGNTISTASKAPIYTEAAGVAMRDNRCTAANSAGISAASAATDTAVVGNTVAAAGASGIGIRIIGASSQVVGNDVRTTGSTAAMSIEAASCVVQGNRVRGGTGEAISVAAAGSGSTVAGNVTTGGSQGLRLAASDCAVTGNRFGGAQFWGISISAGATDNVVTSNVLKGNTSGGVTDGGTTTLLANNKP